MESMDPLVTIRGPMCGFVRIPKHRKSPTRSDVVERNLAEENKHISKSVLVQGGEKSWKGLRPGLMLIEAVSNIPDVPGDDT